MYNTSYEFNSKGDPSMTRSEAREAAVILVYQTYIQKEQPNIIFDIYQSENETAKSVSLEYIKNTLMGVFENIDDINARIKKYAKDWDLDRLSKLSYAILSVAIFEIIYTDTIPDAVAANEAVEMSKKYGEDKLPAFINGVLSSVIKSKAEG